MRGMMAGLVVKIDVVHNKSRLKRSLILKYQYTIETPPGGSPHPRGLIFILKITFLLNFLNQINLIFLN